MFVDPRSSGLKLLREGRTYFFCSSHCLREFAEPERELGALRQKLVVAWPLCLAIVLLTYAVRFEGGPWVVFALASLVEFYPGLQFFAGTREAVRNRTWNMDVLVAVGTGAAYAYSAGVLLLPGRLPPTLYFDASSLIVTVILTGHYLEHLTRERARGTLRRLHELLPATALVLREGREYEIPAAEVRPGDQYRVLPGGRFPADGTVLEGNSSVNEAGLTGESLPVEKGRGDPVIAGATNGDGRLTVVANRVGEDTVLAEIGRLVTEAETSRVPLQRLADRMAASFVPVVLVLATVAAAGWFAVGAGFTIALLVYVSIVITACPCAFGIATPAALVVGTGRAAEEGILFKGGESIERASEVDRVLTDKTGTLTQGRPRLTDVVPAPGETVEGLLSLAASAEIGSEHPFAKAVLEAARLRNVPIAPAEESHAAPGAGTRTRVSGASVEVLSERGARDEGADLTGLAGPIERLSFEGKSGSVVLRNGRPVGLLGFADEIARGVREAIRALGEDRISLEMVTGDRESAAVAVASELGIREFRAGLTPAQKLARIRELQAEGHKVAYVGDGINDAPALSAADLGIAIGSGTEVARESAGVILLRPDFRGVALALRFGRRTVRKVRGNLAWAVGYNAVLLPIAMGALVPALGLGVYNVLPITGAVAMGASSAAVVLNSLSLRWVALGPRRPGAATRATQAQATAPVLTNQ